MNKEKRPRSMDIYLKVFLRRITKVDAASYLRLGITDRVAGLQPAILPELLTRGDAPGLQNLRPSASDQ